MDSVIIGVLATIAGLVSVFSGFRLFRALLAVAFFFIGYAVSPYVIEFLQITNPSTVLIVRLGVGLLLGSAGWNLFSVAVYVFGALFGISVGGQLAAAFGGDDLLIFILGAIGAIIGGSIAAALRKPAVILGTAFIGAGIAVYGVWSVLGFNLPSADGFVPRGSQQAVWLILGLMGAAVQWAQSREWRAEEDM